MRIHFLLLFSFWAMWGHIRADDGYRLWLKYDLLPDGAQRAEYRRFARFVEARAAPSPQLDAAVRELRAGLEGLLGTALAARPKKKGGIIFQTDADIPEEGFRIEEKQGNIYISGSAGKGMLYGAFGLMRLMQTGRSLKGITYRCAPKIQLRMLNHWDNPLGTIERGYAGASLWKWYELPETIDPRYRDYARANASIGINAAAINNVNASARFLTDEYLAKVKALADVFRPYGIQVFLSVNFASPKILGKLDTSDPLDPRVQAWWNTKAQEIYQYIPDFGGFLVKANSEGEPGPQEHGRTHADGANMLARALRPGGGIVIWRAFVYSPDPKGDRFKEAYNEFKPLDGQFDENVVVQVKNGPIDFQPREPFHPLFGAMPRTPLAMEFQITQEYLGFSTNLVYLATLFKECLESDTYVNGEGSTVASVIDGALHGYPITVMAGVANTGSDRNWTGHLMSQANWYAFGRLAWDPYLGAEQIAAEWIPMTWTRDPAAAAIIKNILMRSWDIYVDFSTPLGLHHIMGQGIHFGPEPWLERSARPDWTSVYYHRADSAGVGFDRTASGNNALALYRPEVQARWGDPAACDLNFLLWFHRVPWNAKLSTGNTLWDELCVRYYRGVEGVRWMQSEWAKARPHVDAEMYADVAGRLAAQHREALNWRDACVLYFQTFSKMPVPAPYLQPERTLEEMKRIVEIYQMR
jgi:alpha-glucuronidase